MIDHLRDPANAITAFGIGLSATALIHVMAGRPEIATSFGLWAMIADQLDGIVARRTGKRNEAAAVIGKSLDGFGDLIYGAILPAMLLLAATGDELAVYPVAIGMIATGALRLSYFSAFGLKEGSFIGLPLSYDLPVLAALFLMRPFLEPLPFTLLLTAACTTLAILHVAPVKIPAPDRVGYAAIILSAFGLSVALLFLAL
ncbi:CDP-alcohol phosphatidyltransferase family protein [Agrobacterium rhizogenes]|uniref:CDP-alcohol phosphatidyltransferase family protein n=1 Tax=Rhizobium rhizogenes TaxID=359 RepID=UPI0022B69D39|nr:CDP-alcohol phosphatidyltransferase family protein [Rhizobium rhizogenes]MCZ7450275.1 CDP-alcohol phosphatidyltransferase family protein [Rhizobium rhizogenes]